MVTVISAKEISHGTSFRDPMKWYVVYTRPRHERAVCERLLHEGFEPWLPLAIVWRTSKSGPRKVSTPLFPRYLFVRCYLEMYNHLTVISTPGVIRLMEDEQGHCLVVPDEEIVSLQRLCEAEVAIESATDHHAGQWVEVIGGPLVGLTGVIRKDHPTELLVPVQALKQWVVVTIGKAPVVPVSDLS